MNKKLRKYIQWLQLLDTHPGKASVFYQENAEDIDIAEKAAAGLLQRDRANKYRRPFLP